MKIGFLITYFYPKTGGAENNCYYTARELAKKHEVHVFCSGDKESDELIDGIQVHRSKELFRLKYYFALYPSITQKLMKYNLDVLHVHGLGFIQHDYTLTKLKESNSEIRIIGTPHGPFMALNKYNFIGKIFKNIYTFIIKKSLTKYDAFIQVNPLQKTWMKSEYGIPDKKIFFVPNGINLEVFKPANDSIKPPIIKKYSLEGKFIISYLGRIQKYKGLDQVIKILPELLKIKKNLVFLAIGKDSDDLDRLKKLSSELGVSKNVIFTGEVSEEEKLTLLDLSEIFVFPSEWEAFGIAMLEAMARGNACISSSTEGGRFLIEEGKNGFLYTYKKEDELYKKLSLLVKNNTLRNRIQINNIKKAKSFLWSKISQDLEKVYSKLIHNAK